MQNNITIENIKTEQISEAGDNESIESLKEEINKLKSELIESRYRNDSLKIRLSDRYYLRKEIMHALEYDVADPDAEASLRKSLDIIEGLKSWRKYSTKRMSELTEDNADLKERLHLADGVSSLAVSHRNAAEKLNDIMLEYLVCISNHETTGDVASDYKQIKEIALMAIKRNEQEEQI